MRYKKILPPDYLKDRIRYFWTLESTADDPSARTFKIMADGCPGLIFQQSEKGALSHQYKSRLPRMFLYGQTTRHTEMYSSEPFKAIGACCYPSALKSVFGLNANDLTDSCTDLDAMAEAQSIRLSEHLLNTPSTEDRIGILSSYLLVQSRRNNHQEDETMSYALSRLMQSGGHLSQDKLLKAIGLSERSLERRFKEWVGISPKLFARICRFQASLNQLRANNYVKLSDIAYENQYADQSHFIRSFKEFAGLSPYQYRKRSVEVAENLPELLKK